jgi:peptide/nickel transport system permease protein
MQRVLARLAQAFVVVFVATSIAFLLLRSTKGDALSVLVESQGVTVETLAAMRKEAGLDQPLLVQYTSYLGSVVRGDLGVSSQFTRRPVVTLIAESIKPTLILMTLAFALSVGGGIVLGSWQGASPNTVRERLIDRVTLGIISMPDFWVGTALLILFAIQLQWLPPGQMAEPIAGQSFWQVLVDRVRHLVLPLTALTLVNASVFARYQHASMRGVMSQQFLRTARAKGVDERAVVRRHALRLAVLPQITLAGMYLPALLVGTILIERVFSWPGMGSLLTKAVSSRDHNLVCGIVIVGSAMTAFGSFLADIVREWLDPRLREQ